MRSSRPDRQRHDEAFAIGESSNKKRRGFRSAGSAARRRWPPPCCFSPPMRQAISSVRPCSSMEAWRCDQARRSAMGLCCSRDRAKSTPAWRARTSSAQDRYAVCSIEPAHVSAWTWRVSSSTADSELAPPRIVSRPWSPCRSVCCASSRGGVGFSAAAGHSLGELSAFSAAGCMSYEEAVDSACARGAAMGRAARRARGGMVALRTTTAARSKARWQ